MTLLLTPKPSPPDEKTRNRVGIAAIFKRVMVRGQRVTLEEAIAILREHW